MVGVPTEGRGYHHLFKNSENSPFQAGAPQKPLRTGDSRGARVLGGGADKKAAPVGGDTALP